MAASATAEPINQADLAPAVSDQPPRTLEMQQPRVSWWQRVRQRLIRPAPPAAPVTEEQLARLAQRQIQEELVCAPAEVRVTAEVEGRTIHLYGSVDAVWRKERLVQKMQTLPGVAKVVNHLLAADELDARVLERFQALAQAGTLPEPWPRVLIEHQIVELYGEVATPEVRDLLEREVLSIPGVRVVVNHLRVPGEMDARLHTHNR